MGPEHFWWGGWWQFPIIMHLAMAAIFVVLLYLAFGRRGFRPPWGNDSDRPSSHSGHFETAVEVLEKRYAKGEISREEFEQMKKELQG